MKSSRRHPYSDVLEAYLKIPSDSQEESIYFLEILSSVANTNRKINGIEQTLKGWSKIYPIKDQKRYMITNY